MAVSYRLVSTTGAGQSKQRLAVHLRTYARPPDTLLSLLVSHISLTLQTEMENMCSHKESNGREVYIELCCFPQRGIRTASCLFLQTRRFNPNRRIPRKKTTYYLRFLINCDWSSSEVNRSSAKPQISYNASLCCNFTFVEV